MDVSKHHARFQIQQRIIHVYEKPKNPNQSFEIIDRNLQLSSRKNEPINDCSGVKPIRRRPFLAFTRYQYFMSSFFQRTSLPAALSILLSLEGWSMRRYSIKHKALLSEKYCQISILTHSSLLNISEKFYKSLFRKFVRLAVLQAVLQSATFSIRLGDTRQY